MSSKTKYPPVPVSDINLRERERVAALVAADQQDRAERDTALMDPDGERRLIRPPALVAARRAIAAHGHSEAECTDTIGRLWSWGLLDSAKDFAPDLLRDAGRRYAAAYWFRYGQVCPSIGAYSDMRSGGWPKRTFIADEAVDELIEARFRSRDQALRDVKAKHAVDQVCVDGAGENDPGWLVDLMNGYPAETRLRRVEIATLEQLLVAARTDDEREKLTTKISRQNRALANDLKRLRVALLPAKLVATIVSGLAELAYIDRKDGFHRPKRRRDDDDDR